MGTTRRTAALLALALCVGPVAGAEPARAAKPRLILVVSVDQMRFDYLTRFDALFCRGFRRLLDDGAVFTEARYRHASTETGPGHSVILSGRHPSSSGIIANSWYDSFLRKPVNVVDDPVHSPVGGPGRAASPAHFSGFTLGDVLKQRSTGSRIVSVAGKDRAAILMGGRRADGAYWFDAEAGGFITSTYYAATPPEWLALPRADAYVGREWTRLLPDQALYRKHAGIDDAPGETNGQDRVFPHRLAGARGERAFYSSLQRTPFLDELTLEVALSALRGHGLGLDDATDILAVGFSATDYVGHVYGPDSHEAMDTLLRLDVTLESLLGAVEASAGRGRTLLVLTSDHGVLPLVETLQARGVGARRVDATALWASLERALASRFPGVSGIVAHASDAGLYLDEGVLEKARLDRRVVEEFLKERLLASGDIARVHTREDLLGPPRPDDPVFRLVRNCFFPPRSPHLTLVTKEHVYLSAYPGGTGHGTPYDYDTHVPILWLGPAIKKGRYAEPCGPEDIAPTLARILDLEYPKEPDARLLLEMMD